MIRPGRLKNVLSRCGITSNLFVLFTDSGDWGKNIYKDDTLMSIDLVRGGTGEPVGLLPATTTVKVKGVAPDYKGDFNTDIFVDAVTDTALGFLLSRDKGTFRQRFSGRLLRQTVTDPGPARLRTTELVCTDWGTEALTISENATYVPSRSEGIISWLQTVMAPIVSSTTGHDGYLSDLIWVDPTGGNTTRWFSVGDGMSNLIETGGYVVVPQRAGHLKVHTLAWMDYAAKNWKQQYFPGGTLPRKYCLTPATITKRATHPGKIQYDYRENNGSEWGRTITVGNHTRAVHTQSFDTKPWIRIRPESNNQLSAAMTARANRVADMGYMVPEVHIDLLGLLDPKNRAGTELIKSRAYVGDLLAAEVADPIALGWDWPAEARGVYIITEIAEHIDKDSWTMTLGLTKDKDVTGYQTIPLPPHPTGWDDQYQTWNERPGTWA